MIENNLITDTAGIPRKKQKGIRLTDILQKFQLSLLKITDIAVNSC